MPVKLLMLVCAVQATLYARVVSFRGKIQESKVEVISSSAMHFQYEDRTKDGVNLTSAKTNAVIGGAVGHAVASEKLENEHEAISSKPASTDRKDKVTSANLKLNEWLDSHAQGLIAQQVATNFMKARKEGQKTPSLEISVDETKATSHPYSSYLGRGINAIALQFGDYVLKWYSRMGSMKRRSEIEMLMKFHERVKVLKEGADAVVGCLNTADDGLYVVTTFAPGEKIMYLTWTWKGDDEVERFTKLMRSWLKSIEAVYRVHIENPDQGVGNTMYDKENDKITFFDWDMAVDEENEMTSKAEMLNLARSYADGMIDKFVSKGNKTLAQFPWWLEAEWRTTGSDEDPNWKVARVQGILNLF